MREGEVVEGEEVVASSTHLEQQPIDDEEERKISQFMESGCGCKMWKKGPCYTLFSREHYQTVRGDAAALSWNELNMTVMGEIMALTTMGSHIYTNTLVATSAAAHSSFSMGWGRGNLSSKKPTTAVLVWFHVYRQRWTYSCTCPDYGGREEHHQVHHTACRG